MIGRTKPVYYALTAVSTLAASYYLNYLVFFLHDAFGFGNRGNLGTTAFHGALYTVSSWQAGRFAQRRGFHTSLLIGLAALAVALAAGASARTLPEQFLVLTLYSLALPFIWPALEALITHDETPARVPHTVGIFNCTWSGFGALAYFTGGGLYDWLGRGAVFGIPSILFAGQFVLMLVLARRVTQHAAAPHPTGAPHAARPTAETFVRLARVANPFAYVAIYTLYAVMPSLGARFGLSPGRVGLVCSVWLFGRLASFAVLWHWTGWHYRLRWLLGGYVLLVGSFVLLLTAQRVEVVIAAELAFGVATGLIYYSSLYYSMDVGEAAAEHSGLHEAAIGMGICIGPGLGAAALTWFPAVPGAGAIAVSAALMVGFVVLCWIAHRAGRPARERSAT